MKWQTSNYSLLLIYRARRNERLGWPGLMIGVAVNTVNMETAYTRRSKWTVRKASIKEGRTSGRLVYVLRGWSAIQQRWSRCPWLDCEIDQWTRWSQPCRLGSRRHTSSRSRSPRCSFVYTLVVIVIQTGNKQSLPLMWIWNMLMLLNHSNVGCVAQLVERRSSAGVLSLSYARLAAEGWPFTWVNRPLQVSQLGFHPFGIDKLSGE